MSRRLIQVFANSDRSRLVKVYRDAEWNEFRARLYINGCLESDADAHDDDKGSMFETARTMVGADALDVLSFIGE